MVSTNPADRFIQAYRNLDLFPLLKAEDIAEFRVEYGQRTLVRLKREILALPANGKVMFTGHRGCGGKSTLLNQFAAQMRELKHFVVFFSIADTVEMSEGVGKTH